MNQWWKNTVFYEIYIRSFCDTGQNGKNGIRGITSKLPYLKELGVGGIWLTPFYPSPKVDNGYDVSDYCGVDPDYGTMDDFEEMVKAAHKHGIRVIIDMVLNHTSTQHPWFIKSAASKDSSERDWYIWKDPVNGGEPNNWESFFGGSAWEYVAYGDSGQYYYHSFAKEQADLNWQNPSVEEAIYQVLDFWLLKGVDGFRFDVINNLSVSGSMVDNPVTGNGEQLHENDVNQPGVQAVIKRMAGRIREKKLEELQMQTSFDALQAQVNPHFINNTLNVISYRGTLLEDEEICEVCNDLSSMLKFSTNTKRRIVTVREELDYVECYMELLKYRHRDKFHYEIQVDRQIYQKMLPKIVIQQLVENSVTHGYRTPYEVMEIKISGWLADGRWYIKVSDNGDGFEEKVLAEIRDEMERIRHQILEEHQIQGMEIGGMGLLNIYSRMLLMHNTNFEMDFYNSEDGAEVVLCSS